MTIQVSGQNFEVGESLTTLVTDKINEYINKYELTLISANVKFEKAPHSKIEASIKIILNIGEYFAESIGPDAQEAFDDAFGEALTQIKRELSKLKDHHKK